jgi:O-antigen/teichoic acid export membrane protein
MNLSAEKVTVLLCRVIEAGGGVLFLKMCTSMATKEDVGSYLLASSFLALVLTVTFSALNQGLMRNTIDYQAKGILAKRFSATVATYAILSLALATLCAGLILTLGGKNATAEAAAAFALWLLFDVLKNFGITIATALRRRGQVVGANSIDYGMRAAILFAISAWNKLTFEKIVFTLAISGMAASFYLAWKQRDLLSRFSSRDAKSTFADSMAFSWTLIVAGGFVWLQTMTNRWLLNIYGDTASVAEYGILTSIGLFPITAILGIAITYIQPILYSLEHESKGSSSTYATRALLIISPALMVPILLSAFWHEKIVELLSSKEYVSHSSYLPWIIGSACFSAAGTILTTALYAQRKMSSLLVANTVPGLFSVTFGYFAVSKFSFNGAVASLILGNIISGLLLVGKFWSSGERESNPKRA